MDLPYHRSCARSLRAIAFGFPAALRSGALGTGPPVSRTWSQPPGWVTTTIVLVSILAGCPAVQSADEITVSAEQVKAIGIETEPLARHAAVPKLRFPGRVVIPPHQIRIISVPLAGRIEAVAVSVDTPVSQGQVLAQLSGPNWTGAQFEFLQAVRQEKFLRGTLERERALSADRILAAKQMLATQNEYTQATTTLSEKRIVLKLCGMSDAEIDQLASSGTLSTSLPITAPIGGMVLESSLISGQSVETLAPLFKIAALSPLWLEWDIPFTDLAGRATRAAWTANRTQSQASITRAPSRRWSSGFGMRRRAGTTSGACAGRPGSSARIAVSPASLG